jgi:hypothetical protein
MREAGDTDGKTYEAKIVLTVEGLDIEHVVTGQITGSKDA